MTKYLITPSLINSLSWYLKESFTKTEAEQRQEFLQTLRREKTPTTEAQAKGIKLENDILDCCNGKYLTFRPSYRTKYNSYDFVVDSLAKIVKGGLWQQSVKKDIKVGNQDFILYGRTDVIKRGTIFDIKYTSKYELGKFQDSIQHLIYLYCSDLPEFSYLISDGKDWWREDYFNYNNIEDKIKSKISEFLDYLEGDKEAKELFNNKWLSKY